MARKNRRKKIQRSIRKARKRMREREESLKDPETCTGQSICTLEVLEAHDEKKRLERDMDDEEEIVALTADDENKSTQTWFQWFFGISPS